MAHMFPDCIGEVDVVSDAENIKCLLKIPYSNKSVICLFYLTNNLVLKIRILKIKLKMFFITSWSTMISVTTLFLRKKYMCCIISMYNFFMIKKIIIM